MAGFVPASPMFPRPRPDRPKPRDLTKDEVEGIMFAYETLDVDRLGYVTPRQLKVALRALGFGVRKPDVVELMRKHGEEDNDKLSFQTFHMLVADKLQERTIQDEFRRAFQLFDVQGSGYIDFASLKKVVRSLGLEIEDAELNEMVHDFDLDKDGAINMDEFMVIMQAGSD